MTDQQIKVLAKYLGCKCQFIFQRVFNEVFRFDAQTLSMIHDLDNFRLHLNDISSLTQEGFTKMCDELHPNRDSLYNETWFQDITQCNDFTWREADWLRNNGYYLGEESIKEYVKLK
jgi:hypothetical protein